jgi:UDP-GlcNAc3NAcA epimerase
MTDSGGVQKEAFFFKKPCITLRDETEWGELIKAGVNKLCPTEKSLIIKKFNEMSEAKLSFDENIYGGGKACQSIIEYLLTH